MHIPDCPDFFYFDLGNVLLFFDHEIAVRNLAQLTAQSTERVRRAVFTSGLEIAYETGTISSQEFLEAIERDLEVDIPLQAALDAASDIFTENIAMLGCLKGLQEMGMRLGLLSNTCHAHWDWVQRQRYTTVQGWFEFHILSYEERLMKPDIALYERAAARTGVPCERILFIDDRIENVEGARRAGWKAELFVDTRQVQAWIDAWRPQ